MPEDGKHGTIQMRPGGPPDQATSVMPTLTGEPPPAAAPPAMPPPRYELGEEIARGGMGRVVDATDTVLGRVVALKEALALDTDSLTRFARETKITARLEHPAIVPVHDAGTMAGGAPFYVMRKVGGRPLERLVATTNRLDQRLALLPHIVTASHAIAHAHSRGIVHRDIKPSNILCGDHGETIVIDWGLAKVIGEADEPTAPAAVVDDDSIKTRAGVVYGTPGFMAPEQLRGVVVDERCDVYALGATLYHLLSRKPPHYAKTAEEMMKAAVAAPPSPVSSLVPGVPRELSTIVDKALAHDPKLRYQDANALAEDLQRFLTGQLVASHHYTSRERLVRFVRKNRFAVGAVGVAVAALLIGGTIAVTRVIGERDRADLEARKSRAAEAEAKDSQRRAEDRNEKLVLQQARSMVTVNPTAAVAMIKPLATKQWREVRSIANAARTNGVAWSLPAPRFVDALEMSRDGLRVLLSGDDGSIRIYDLARRVTRTVRDRGSRVHVRFADGERKVVAWAERTLIVLDASTGAETSRIEVGSPIYDLEVIGMTAYWVDGREGKLWSLDLAGKIPLEITVEERLEQLAPSPDGRWLALLGTTHLFFYDRTQPQTPPVEVLLGRTLQIDWADNGEHVAALVERGEETERYAILISVTDTPQIVRRIHVGKREHIALASGPVPRVFAVGALGVGFVSRDETTPRKQVVGEPVGLRESIDGTVVAGSHGGLAVLTDDGDQSLLVPTGRLETIEASARSPYVVGMIENRMLVWDLSEFLPRRLAVRVATTEKFAGNARVFAAYQDAPAEWIDLAVNGRFAPKSRPTAAMPATIEDLVAARDGSAVVVLDGRNARLVVDGQEPVLIEDAHRAIFAGDQLFVATLGKIDRYDLATKQRTPVAARSSELLQLTSSRGAPGWLAAVFADGTLWRMNLANNLQTITAIAAVPRQILVQVDGSVVYSEGRMLRAWRPNGTLEPLVELPKTVDALGLAAPNRAVAFAANGTGYVIELDAPGRHSEPFEVYVQRATISPDVGLLVTGNRGVIELIDPLLADPYRWTLASSSGIAYTMPQIANDGSHVLARRRVVDRTRKDVESMEQHVLLVWRLVMPSTAEDTQNWLARMTNAVFDPQTSVLGWQ